MLSLQSISSVGTASGTSTVNEKYSMSILSICPMTTSSARNWNASPNERSESLNRPESSRPFSSNLECSARCSTIPGNAIVFKINSSSWKCWETSFSKRANNDAISSYGCDWRMASSSSLDVWNRDSCCWSIRWLPLQKDSFHVSWTRFPPMHLLDAKTALLKSLNWTLLRPEFLAP